MAHRRCSIVSLYQPDKKNDTDARDSRDLYNERSYSRHQVCDSSTVVEGISVRNLRSPCYQAPDFRLVPVVIGRADLPGMVRGDSPYDPVSLDSGYYINFPILLYHFRFGSLHGVCVSFRYGTRYVFLPPLCGDHAQFLVSPARGGWVR